MTTRRRTPVGVNPPWLAAAREAAPMFDTLAVARRLAEAGFDPAQADALTAARPASGEHVTQAGLDARISAQDDRIDARISALEARIYRAMLLQAGAIVGAVVAILRFAG